MVRQLCGRTAQCSEIKIDATVNRCVIGGECKVAFRYSWWPVLTLARNVESEIFRGQQNKLNILKNIWRKHKRKTIKKG